MHKGLVVTTLVVSFQAGSGTTEVVTTIFSHPSLSLRERVAAGRCLDAYALINKRHGSILGVLGNTLITLLVTSCFSKDPGVEIIRSILD